MTAYWDDKFLEMWNDLCARRQIIAAEERALPPEDWEAGVLQGVVEYEGRLIEIEEKELLGGQASLRLPRSMQLMPRGIGARGQVLRGHEQAVFTNEDSSVMFGLSLMTHRLQLNDLEALQSAMTVQAKKLRSDVQLVREDIIERNGGKMVCCEYVIPTPLSMYYQMMFATSWQGRAIWGSFHFDATEALLWQPLSHALIRSLRFHDLVQQ
ncbi:hypothetical protein [Paenibacillus apiarius]|uniref:hypothetical protein n=1 Tax=Paenibacillus apiarius TaxID=46240 RepID=UPI003B3AE653